jgi:prepilin-type N-terminal cleavage/methylation domain-containing protein
MGMTKNQGFTITELMIAVVIMGVLATLAIPSFSGYLYKSRVTEATTFLGEIKQRQEAYRSEFGEYCAVNGNDWGNYHPPLIPGMDPVMWTTTPAWRQLGASPDGPTRFQYATVAGIPGGGNAPANTNLNTNDYWFAARAQGDLNEDGIPFFLEIYSQGTHIYNSATARGGWD